MKYQSWSAFEKHLTDATPSSVYLIVSPCPFERKKIGEKIVWAIQKKDPAISPIHAEASDCSPDQILEQLNTRSLFGDLTVVILDGIEKWKKAELEPLLGYVANPSPFAHLLLGASSAKGLQDLYTQGKKELVSLDLSEEKPWDKKTRLEKYLVQYALQEKKSIHPQAVSHLLEGVGPSLPSLEQEMIKLLCYVGERKTITIEDVHAVCFTQKELNFWQLAEAVIWGDNPVPIDPLFDLSQLLPLIGQLRNQLQIGAQIQSMLAGGLDLPAICKQLPQCKAPVVEKRIAQVKREKIHAYQDRLHHLFEMELLAKNSSLSPSLLLHMFIGRSHV